MLSAVGWQCFVKLVGGKFPFGNRSFYDGAINTCVTMLSIGQSLVPYIFAYQHGKRNEKVPQMYCKANLLAKTVQPREALATNPPCYSGWVLCGMVPPAQGSSPNWTLKKWKLLGAREGASKRIRSTPIRGLDEWSTGELRPTLGMHGQLVDFFEKLPYQNET